MCEIFGITANREIQANSMLKEFFSHSREHQNGWGIATFDGFSVSVEREPIQASKSVYLKNRLTGDIMSSKMMAHIRRATTGFAEYNNTHPFVARDGSGRSWTLVHNGHIFDAPVLHKYLGVQKGTTDSERILLYIVDRINMKLTDKSGCSDTDERFRIVEDTVKMLSEGNKLNILLYDGECMYVHNNDEGSLFIKKDDNAAVFSTKPLDDGRWEPLQKNKLFVYKDTDVVYEGSEHDNTYVSDPEKEKSMYIQFSGL